MKTLLLTENWELQIDAAGQIVTQTGPLAIAQKVANEIRLFTNDAYFEQDKGIPHFSLELGHMPPESLLRNYIIKAAQGVDGVASATVEFVRFENRTLEGVVYLTLKTGESLNVNF